MGVELIDRLDVDIDICTQCSACCAVGCNAIDAASEFDGIIERHHRIITIIAIM